MITLAEENYLKTILNIYLNSKRKVSTNEIAREMNTSPASVSDMLKKLLEKGLVKYEKYKGAELSKKGSVNAINILRKHRLWETFLVNRLGFNWSEVHDLAEELEHVNSEKLINKLDAFLGYPKFDPHGEPIPTKEGKIPFSETISLDKLQEGILANVMGVNSDEKTYLDYLTKLNISIGSKIIIKERIDFDQSLKIKINNKNHHISYDVAKNLLIKIK